VDQLLSKTGIEAAVSPDFQAEIAQREADVARQKQTMENASRALITAFGKFLRNWYGDKAQQVIQQENAVAAVLNQAAMNQLMNEVAALSGQANNIASQSLNHPELWWHKDPTLGARRIKGPAYGRPKDLDNGSIGGTIRYAMGELGTCLIPRGFLRKPGNPNKSKWTNPDPGGPDRPYFPDGNLNLSAGVLDALKGYNQSYQRALALQAEIADIRRLHPL
jgi:hypothetical protein